MENNTENNELKTDGQKAHENAFEIMKEYNIPLGKRITIRNNLLAWSKDVHPEITVDHKYKTYSHKLVPTWGFSTEEEAVFAGELAKYTKLEQKLVMRLLAAVNSLAGIKSDYEFKK